MDRSSMSPEEFDKWVAQESEAAGTTGVAQPGWLSAEAGSSQAAPAAGTADPGESAAPGGADVAEPEWLKAGPATPAARTPAARTPAPEEPRSTTSRARRGGVLAVVAAVAVAGALAATGLALNAKDSEAEPTSVAAASTTPEIEENTWCTGMGEGVVATLDSDDPGLAAIAGFERAYYVLRDGRRVREYVAPDARVGSAEKIDGAIRQVPVGTTHCVLAKKTAEGAYAVDLFERRPDGTSEFWQSTMLTATTPDGTRITAILSRG
ncbi:hypothetical protein G419_24099 [Rhodococcus triatomae BKS 15-14]|nr:hypothetical protein G419_24099 [Rhodococcus triatomae BKS 15-14]